MDSQIVNPHDVASNFFLVSDQIGQCRAQSCVTLLQELNPLVAGSAVSYHEESSHIQDFNKFDQEIKKASIVILSALILQK